MKNVWMVAGALAILGVGYFAIGGGGDQEVAVAQADVVPGTQVVLPVKGMTCSSCAVSVKWALNGVEGIRDVKVDVGKGEVAVTYADDAVTLDQMIEAINKTGFVASKPAAG